MTISSQICKRIYQADGENRRWAIDFPYLSASEIKVYCTDASGNETDVSAQCVLDEIEHEIIYPTVASEQEPLAAGYKVTIVRATTPTQTLHLTQQGTLDATSLEQGFDKLTFQVQELAERVQRSIKYPVSSNQTDGDAQTFLTDLQNTQAAALSSALTEVAATKTSLEQTVSDEATARQLADSTLQTRIDDIYGSLVSHSSNTSNPHSVTKSQVGLGNVDNTSDLSKPISTAVQSALDAKQDTLTTTQQAAVNSGVTNATVVQVQTNKEDIASLDAELDENREWQKPEDWIDITSGALNNSIYLLIGHSADYSKFPYFGCNVVLSDTTHNFKLYIDYNLQGTYASGTDVKLSWQTLNLSTGSQTTFPEELKTHVIRITPENSADTIAEYKSVRYASGTTAEYQGVLWAHFAVNSIGNVAFAQYSPQVVNQDLVALTALGDNLHITGTSIERLVGNTQDKYQQRSQYLAKLPVIEVDTVTAIGGAFNHAGPLKRAKLIVNNSITAYSRDQYGLSTSFASGNIEEIEVNKPIIMDSWTASNSSLFRVSNIKKLPAFDFSASQRLAIFLTENTNLEDMILDVSAATNLKQIEVFGTSSKRQDGLKGLYVSSSAPFDYATAPQIKVSYTGLSRAALVNLFKSMPYNVGYTVVGSPTITNGVASGFSVSDYVNLSSTLTSFDEIVLSFIPDTYSSGRNVLFKTGINDYRGAFQQVSDTQGQYFYTKTDNTAGNRYVPCTPGIVNIFKIQYISENSISCILSRQGYEDSTFDLTDVDISATFGGSIYLGRGTSAYNAWSGSIDLNNTYIKVNGVPWFRGTAAMTKNCTIVGCTGTADLTADDKAIATGKGWELTVA